LRNRYSDFVDSGNHRGQLPLPIAAVLPPRKQSHLIQKSSPRWSYFIASLYPGFRSLRPPSKVLYGGQACLAWRTKNLGNV